jgi:hypothetical protein
MKRLFGVFHTVASVDLCASLRRPCAKRSGAAKPLWRLELQPQRRFFTNFKDPVLNPALSGYARVV